MASRISGLIVAISIVPTVAMAEDGEVKASQSPNPIKEQKIKISCESEFSYRLSAQDGKDETVNQKDRHESIRRVWADGNTEYRVSESVHYDAEGKVIKRGRHMAKFVVTKDGDKETEFSQTRSFMMDERTDLVFEKGNPWQWDGEATSVYLVKGTERQLISYARDGNSLPTNGSKEVEIRLGKNKKVIKATDETPYTEEWGGTKVEILKSEMVCLHEEIE